MTPEEFKELLKKSLTLKVQRKGDWIWIRLDWDNEFVTEDCIYVETT